MGGGGGFPARNPLFLQPALSHQRTAVQHKTAWYKCVVFALYFRPWTHTSDDSYIYQLSLDSATATVSS